MTQAEQQITEEQQIKNAVTQYIDTWNTGDLESINHKLKAFWTPESSYIDSKYPLVKGFEEFAAFIKAIHDELPELKIIQSSKIEYHNNSGRFSWVMKIHDEILLTGMDYFEYNNEYKLTRTIGFFDYAV